MIESILSIGSRDYYSSELTRKFDVEIKIVSIHSPSGFALIRSLDQSRGISEVIKYLEALKNRKEIIDVDITHREDEVYWTKATHKLESPSIHDTILETNSMSIFPIILKNGIQLHKIYSPTSESFKKLIKLLKYRFDIVEIKSLTNRPSSKAPLLSKKQKEAILIALNQGYYEIPKRTTITEIANKLKISRSATQERLQRGEKKIFESTFKSSEFEI